MAKELKFINVKPTSEDKDDLLKYFNAQAEWHVDLAELVGADNKVGLTWSDRTQAYHVSCFPRDEKSKNHGLCLTSRHSDPLKAIVTVLYFDRFVLEGDWNTASSKIEDEW